MDIGINDTLCALETTDADLLTDLGNCLVQQDVDGLGLVIDEGLCVKLFDGCGSLHGDLLCDGGDESLEIIGLCDEVGLTVDLDDNADGTVFAHIAADDTFCGNAAGLLGCCGKPLLTEIVDRLIHIAFTLGEGLLAVHHTAAGTLAEFLNIFRGKHILSSSES